jgi:Protein of unknown function with PCYCGC motif
MGVKRSVSIGSVLLAVVALGVWSVRASGQAAPAAPAHQHVASATPSSPSLTTGASTKPLVSHKQANLPPLPFGPRDPLPRPTPVVAAVFQFAAEHPEILTYVPCFCGCDHMGHKGNEDCFVKSRAPNGDVVQWEPHGTECQVCIDVGQMAMQMYSSGASVRDIRAAVEKKFAGVYQNHTPTPPPPAPSSK